MDRVAFLARIRSAAENAAPVDLPLAFPPTPASGDGASDPDRFLAALAANNSLGRVVAVGDLAAAVADIARGLGSGRRVVVTADVDEWRAEIDRGLAEAGAEAVRPDPPGWRDEAAGAEMGITSAALAVAATGSLLLVPGPLAPRAASLLPLVHLAIVPVDRLVPGLDEAMAGVEQAARMSSAPVLVTGPSRTSDIEMTTVYGAHGPRALHVLLLT